MFTVRRVSVDCLPPGSADLRVLHISDLHVLPEQHLKLDFIRSLADLEPDLVVNTGDNISNAASVLPLLSALERLRGVPGVFVFGSNDYFAPAFRNPLSYLPTGRSDMSEAGKVRPPNLPTDVLRGLLEGLGWVDLNHHRATLEVKGLRVGARGTDDGHLDRDDYSLVAGPVDPSDDLSIAVTHAPYLRLLDAMTDDGVGVIFAGHTHGGQIRVPGYGPLITNCDLDADRARGLSTHQHGGRESWLHVSAGAGSSPYAPYRFACRPEATLLTLTAKQA